MKLTVIVISYNEKKYLKQAIDSCLNQSFSDMEIIVGDDGSNDGSDVLIGEYCRSYPGKITSFVMDRGTIGEGGIPSIRVSNVIKEGIQRARGKYIICLSGDDYFNDRNSFEKQVSVLERDKKGVYSACVTNYQKIWDDGKIELKPLKKYSPYIYWSGHYLHLSCFMFRKKVYSDNYFLTHFCDDTGLEFSLACAGKWYYIDEVSFFYRQRDKSIMHEADILEQALLELLLYQDVLSTNKMRLVSSSRFAWALNYVYNNFEKLKEEKYKKYMVSTYEYEKNLLGELQKINEISFNRRVRIVLMIFRARCLNFLFRMVRRIKMIY